MGADMMPDGFEFPRSLSDVEVESIRRQTILAAELLAATLALLAVIVVVM